jgi:hypothetical protein
MTPCFLKSKSARAVEYLDSRSAATEVVMSRDRTLCEPA